MKKRWFKNIETGEERLLTLEDAKRELDDKWVRGRVIDKGKIWKSFIYISLLLEMDAHILVSIIKRKILTNI